MDPGVGRNSSKKDKYCANPTNATDVGEAVRKPNGQNTWEAWEVESPGCPGS